MISSHLFLLMSHSFLATAWFWIVTADNSPTRSETHPFAEDQVYQHIHRLYGKYNKEGHLKEGNTVRGVRSSQDATDNGMMYRLNLTTLQDSEVVLSATFHFLLDKHPHPKSWFCRRFKSPSCRSASVRSSPSVSLILRAVSSGSEVRPGSTGSFLGNVTFHLHRRGVWQMKDVTQVIKEARDRGHLLVSVEMDFGQQYQYKPEETLSVGNAPYLLLYANDQALSEPNSVSPSLQRYDPLNEGTETSHSSQSSQLFSKPNPSSELKGRVRREANLLLDPIQNNELPGVEYKPSGYRKEDLWESTWYLALKPKPKSEKKEKKRKSQEEVVEQGRGAHESHALKGGERPQQGVKTDESTVKKLKDTHTIALGDRRKQERIHEGGEGKKHKGSDNIQSPVLSFDEQTMRKARRRQWSGAQQRGCSRRNLRVDFADIGWSEWVIEPKAFDAYYCAGTCGFPMPKVVRPSNHATIQSIVRAVGIIPGVPEPCCVPESMSPLAVLYQDESRNPVLKIYPNMSVQSCSCR